MIYFYLFILFFVLVFAFAFLLEQCFSGPGCSFLIFLPSLGLKYSHGAFLGKIQKRIIDP